jgi:hypothetical protein
MRPEHGDVCFVYRPRVGVEDVRSLGDVQRFFLVLAPAQAGERPRFRRIVVGRKRLPDPSAHEREWAFVAEVSESLDGWLRVQPEARSAGKGRYQLSEHDGHTHLAYVLRSPRQSADTQRLFNIRPEASYIVAAVNPEAPPPPSLGLRPSRRADIPPSVIERFRGRRWMPLSPDLLDVEGLEFVLIGAAEDAGAELDDELERANAADPR